MKQVHGQGLAKAAGTGKELNPVIIGEYRAKETGFVYVVAVAVYELTEALGANTDLFCRLHGCLPD